MIEMKVLIVDDNRQMRNLIRTSIESIVDSFYECSDGAEALDAYTRHRPDWVLMDIEMGKVNGIVATRRIKADYPDARIIVITNYNDEPLREAAKGAGACGFVLKENLLGVLEILKRTPDFS